MPIYEYHCKKCHKTFEQFQKIMDDPLTTCPDCGGKVERLISQTSFSLKGGGWYKDGYGSPKPEKKAETKKVGGSEKKGESSKDKGKKK